MTSMGKLIRVYREKKYCVEVHDVSNANEYYEFWTLEQCEMFISRIASNDDISEIKIYELEV